jgi:hypothetical protein
MFLLIISLTGSKKLVTIQAISAPFKAFSTSSLTDKSHLNTSAPLDANAFALSELVLRVNARIL